MVRNSHQGSLSAIRPQRIMECINIEQKNDVFWFVLFLSFLLVHCDLYWSVCLCVSQYVYTCKCMYFHLVYVQAIWCTCLSVSVSVHVCTSVYTHACVCLSERVHVDTYAASVSASMLVAHNGSMRVCQRQSPGSCWSVILNKQGSSTHRGIFASLISRY